MTNESDESGKSLWGIIKSIGAVATVLFVLAIALKYFLGALFGDSIVESTIKEITSRAISASSQLISGQTIKSGDGSATTDRGYPISVASIDNSFFEITVSNVPRSVCRGIMSRGWSLPTSIYINGRLSTPQLFLCSSSNQMSFEFSRDLNENISNAIKPRQSHCRTDLDCLGCETCRTGRCISGCRAGEKCAQTLKGRSVCCSESNTTQSMCCAFTEGDSCCWGRNQCCPKEKPIRLADGTCTDCYDKQVWGIGDPPDLELCHTLCPNRTDFGADNLCMLPLCTQGEFTARTGDCISCTSGGGYQTSASECAKCPNRSYQNGWCIAPCPSGTVLNTDNQCIPCDEPKHIDLPNSENCQQNCPQRESSPFGCVLKNCPNGFAPDSQRSCFNCTSPYSISDISAEACAQCPNRVYENGKCQIPCPPHTFRDRDGQCIDCSDANAIPVIANDLECQKCPERLALNGYCFAPCATGQFRDAFGTCHSCTDLGSFPVLQTDICAICPNRSIFLQQQGNQIIPHCMLQYCPLDFFADRTGSCRDCFDPTPVPDTRREECEKCPNRQWSFVGDVCRIKPDCSGSEIINAQGVCQSCRAEDEAISVEGHPEECIHCSNRYLFGSWCRKCPINLGTLTNRAGCEKCGGDWDNRIQKCTGK
ncbi:MAG: hypothetical protein SPL08_02530 [Pseudomonadota bacterium]|nr:hypothetical protein [Pseudomonadota bacterium]